MTRHNTGRIALGDLVKINETKLNKKLNALVDKIKIGREKVQIIFPETYMNKSGLSLKPLVNKIVKKNKVCPVGKRSLSHGAKNLIVVHDDLDLALGKFKISFGSGSAGHRGVESIIKNIKTKDFIRIRVGISPLTPSGKIKKPHAKKVINYIISKFKPKEFQIIRKVATKITAAIEAIVNEGLQKAMSLYN